jgi:peptidoglycan/xylan/chitin deacetylase (PgdA/CDA1 family)
MKELLKNKIFPCGYRYLNILDRKISEYSLNFCNEKKSLITILFHGLFNDEDEIKLNHVDPQQSMTIEKFEQFIKYFKKHNYSFVSPDDIIKGLDSNKNHILITFDDGYYSNLHALPILKKYDVPALFFISSNHVIQNKCFWWDVIYRQRVSQGVKKDVINIEIESFKDSKNSEIENYIKKEFGYKALQPISNIDRPFTPDELRKFAKNKHVFIGNHTNNHAILTNYDVNEMREEIENSQNSILDMTGVLPTAIAYPNGNYSNDVISVSKSIEGLEFGITTLHKKNLFPLFINENDPFTLSRFTLWGNKNINSQCRFFRSDLHLLRKISRIYQNWNL